MTCDQCGRLSVATHRQSDFATVHTDVSFARTFWGNRTDVDVDPAWIAGGDFPDVPAHIAGAASEAYQCNSIRANASAVLMARTVVEATAKEKGITSGDLFQKIDALGAQGHITPIAVRTAHVIRRFGNDMAHGDLEPVDDADVREILVFMSQLLEEVFQTPARLDRLSAEATKRAAARKAAK